MSFYALFVSLQQIEYALGEKPDELLSTLLMKMNTMQLFRTPIVSFCFFLEDEMNTRELFNDRKLTVGQCRFFLPVRRLLLWKISYFKSGELRMVGRMIKDKKTRALTRQSKQYFGPYQIMCQ